MTSVGFEPKFPTIERPQTHALDSAVTAIRCSGLDKRKYSKKTLGYSQRSLQHKWKCSIKLATHLYLLPKEMLEAK
jgi:hypothetical protein